MDIFQDEIERLAIERIQKFSNIADKLGFEVCLGFLGGKDSQVVYDLCLRSGIKFKAYFNHSFESNTTLKFIRENYPDVIKRRDYKFGFIENIWKNHNGLLPTVQIAYCCNDYKHNSSKYMESNKLSLYEKIQAVSNEIKNLEKDMTVGKGTNAYKAISDKSVILAVKKAEEQYRIISIPYKQELVSHETVTVQRREDHNR